MGTEEEYIQQSKESISVKQTVKLLKETSGDIARDVFSKLTSLPKEVKASF